MGKTMATPTPTLRPLSCWKSILRHSRQQKSATRSLTTYHKPAPLSKAPLPPPSQAPTRHVNRKLKVVPPPVSFAKVCKEPIKAFTEGQTSILDPTGARSHLFSRTNTEAAKVGDPPRATKDRRSICRRMHQHPETRRRFGHPTTK